MSEGQGHGAYERTLSWLYALEAAKGMDFKLERVALALRRLGDPHHAFRAVHVAGTNGKGSVAAMLHAVLTQGGYRSGLYVSPHLVSFTERIRIGTELISEAEVVELTAEIQRTATSSGIELTFFEFVTVMAFLHFARARIDVGVIEVGLGGRLDATNVIDPDVAIITTIGMDHEQYLGNTIAAVAAEKGGIIKTGRPLVLGQVGSEAAAVLRGLAAERRAPVVEAGVDFRVTEHGPLAFEGLGWSLGSLDLGLRGGYQRANAATALAALALLRDVLPISDAAIRSGLAAVRWPGRLDVVAEQPLTILDGAHNPQGVDTLCRELPGLLGDRRLHLLFAVMADKDWRPMVERLAPLCDTVVVTEVLPPRGQPAGPVAQAFARWCEARADPDVTHAWAAIRAQAHRDDAIVVAGSLFLVGAVLPLCKPSGAASWPTTGAPVQP